MARSKAVDNSELERWRDLHASDVLCALADHAVPDPAYASRASKSSTRWHVSAAGHDFEVLCTGPKFLDTRANKGGGGAIDLTMHLLGLSFLEAVKVVRAKGL